MYKDVECITFHMLRKTFSIDLDVKRTLVWGNVLPDNFLAVGIWYKVTKSWKKQLSGKGYGVY